MRVIFGRRRKTPSVVQRLGQLFAWIPWLAVFILVLAIGVHGYWTSYPIQDNPTARIDEAVGQNPPQPPHLGVSEAVHQALQLITLNGSFEGIKSERTCANQLGLETTEEWRWLLSEHNCQLQFSRIALPILVAWATIQLFLLQIGGFWFRLRLRWSIKNHTVFIGAGRLSEGTVQNLVKKDQQGRKPRQHMIALDLNVDSETAYQLSCNGVDLIQGDATSRAQLDELFLHKADSVYILTGDDQRNIAICKIIVDALSDKTTKPRLIVDVDDPALIRLASKYTNCSANESAGQKVHLHWYSEMDLATRQLLVRHPPVYQSEKDRPVHIVIAGFDSMGEALLVQAIRHCLYFNEKPLHVSLLHNDRTVFESFLLKYPMLDPVHANEPCFGGLLPLANVHFHLCNLAGPLYDAMREVTCRSPIDHVYVTTSASTPCQLAVQQIHQALTILGDSTTPIVACLRSDRKSTSRDAGNEEDRISYFRMEPNADSTQEEFAGIGTDLFGRYVHAAYAAGHVAPAAFQEQLEESFRSDKGGWDSMSSEDDRRSSRYAGDHVHVKLRELGFDLKLVTEPQAAGVSSAVLLDAINENLDQLKRVEHRRFCAERLLDGWLFNPVKMKGLRLNDTLVPFDLLSEGDNSGKPNEKAKDERIVLAIPAILAAPEIAKHWRLVKRDASSGNSD